MKSVKLPKRTQFENRQETDASVAAEAIVLEADRSCRCWEEGRRGRGD